jgi:hypothetical protein
LGSRASLEVLKKKKYLLLPLDKPQYLSFPNHILAISLTMLPWLLSQDGGSGENINDNDDEFMRLLHNFKFCIHE